MSSHVFYSGYDLENAVTLSNTSYSSSKHILESYFQNVKINNFFLLIVKTLISGWFWIRLAKL